MRSSPVVLTILFWTHSLFAGQLYWTTGFGMTIETANTDGTGYHTLLSAGTCSTGIAVDPVGGQIYWTGVQGRCIRSANLDGTNIHTIVQPSNNPNCIIYDSATKQLYWNEDWPVASIKRSNSDGSSLQTVLTLDAGYGSGIAIDNDNGYLYWANTQITGIYRSRLDGSDLVEVVSTGVSPIAIALDVQNNKVYWTENGQDTQCIRRADLDGSNTETLVSDLWNPIGLALDLSENKIYWTDYGKGVIQRANLDGSNVEDVLNNLTNPEGLAIIVPDPTTLLLISLGLVFVVKKQQDMRSELR